MSKLDSARYKSSVTACRARAEAGDSGAQTTYGIYLEDGITGYPDYGEAARWFRKAAIQGDVDGQLHLAWALESGRGVLQDYAKSRKWFLVAAESGEGHAIWALGRTYRDAKGVQQDFVEAHKWLNLAAAKGYTVAGAERDSLAERMTAAQIAEAHRLAREWLEKHPNN